MVEIVQVKILDPSQYFRPEDVQRETGWNFRTYKEDTKDPKMKRVVDTYKAMHQNQCMEFVANRKEKWCRFDKFKATIMEVLEKLDNLIDESDPDSDFPNSIHAFQTAERIRKEHPNEEWFHLTGLIHDIGKVMALYDEPQWSTVGDTYPVGCAFSENIVYRKSSFLGNPDIDNEKFNSKYGIYEPNCGLDNVNMIWGHDEYMYRVLKENGTTLPQEALYIIRYHSFYPWHTCNDYAHLTNNVDEEMLPWINEFNKFDLYTKKEEIPDMEKLKPYYMGLIEKYCPGKLRW